MLTCPYQPFIILKTAYVTLLPVICYVLAPIRKYDLITFNYHLNYSDLEWKAPSATANMILLYENKRMSSSKTYIVLSILNEDIHAYQKFHGGGWLRECEATVVSYLFRKLGLHHFAGTPDVIFANHTLRFSPSLKR